MNREIKFRGKCSPQSKYKGEWVTGSLVVPEIIKDNELLIVVAHSDNCKTTYHVDKDTVGQFTGLRDKNGKEIYEDDIIYFDFCGEKYIVCVGFNNEIGAWCVAFKGSGYVGTTPLGKMLCEYDDMEVIGNIHDNPELIKEEKK